MCGGRAFAAIFKKEDVAVIRDRGAPCLVLFHVVLCSLTHRQTLLMELVKRSVVNAFRQTRERIIEIVSEERGS